METPKWIKWAFIVPLFLVFLTIVVSSANTIPTLQEDVKASWGQVENVYQRRADLIPNLVEVVQGFAKHEKGTLEAVIKARASATQMTVPKDILTNPAAMKQFQQAQDSLAGALGRLMVISERYPELKANHNFLELQSQLEGTENRISVERKRFVETVSTYNKYVRTFPGVLWAKTLFDAQPMEQFTADTGAKAAPKVTMQ